MAGSVLVRDKPRRHTGIDLDKNINTRKHITLVVALLCNAVPRVCVVPCSGVTLNQHITLRILSFSSKLFIYYFIIIIGFAMGFKLCFLLRERASA